jgi:cysteine desulfurase / selenocysteine lyase
MTTAARPDTPHASPALDPARVKGDFPILSREVGGKPLVYLDSAATSQKPACVIDAVRDYYERHNSNVHRGVHRLSVEATDLFEEARGKAAAFVGAADPREMIHVRGTTEAINLVAQSYARPRLVPGDEVLVTGMEHHSNIVPWQLVCQQTGATLRVVDIDDDGALVMEDLDRKLNDRTRIVAAVHVSNALGTVNPVAEIAKRARAAGAVTVVDGAQAAGREPIHVQTIGCDFYAFSGHKVFGPTGIGYLWGRTELLEEMPPWMGGGDMITSVTFEGSTWARIPAKFEAGTPNVAGAVGLGAALDYVDTLGLGAIAAHEQDLLQYGTKRLREVEGLRLIGTAAGKVGILSFVLQGIHPHDIGTVLDREGIAIRTGHHCAQPVMKRYGVPATVRASLAAYNSRSDLDALADGLARVRTMFS